MLFRKNIPAKCTYCAYGCRLKETEVLCRHKGIIMDTAHACRKFRYDPFKRTPQRPASLHTEHLKAEDFAL